MYYSAGYNAWPNACHHHADDGAVRDIITPDEPGGSRADMSRGAEEGLQLPWVMSAHHGSTGVVPTVVCGAETMLRPISSRGQPLQQWLDGII